MGAYFRASGPVKGHFRYKVVKIEKIKSEPPKPPPYVHKLVTWLDKHHFSSRLEAENAMGEMNSGKERALDYFFSGV